MRIIPQTDFKQGRWRNGQGVSWEIASHQAQGAPDFAWRFAKARIDNDVPFSIYPGMDRIFMMLDGGGMDLNFESGKVLRVHEKFVPHQFSCDVPLQCKLLDGPSVDLNLFAARDTYGLSANIETLEGEKHFKTEGSIVVFYALQKTCIVNGSNLNEGDAAVASHEDTFHLAGHSASVFVGILRKF